MAFMASGVAHLLLLGCGLGVSRAASPEWSGVTKVLEAFDFEEAEDAPLDDDEEEDALVDDVEVVLTGLEETLSAPGGVRPPVRPTGTITVGW